MKSFQLHQCIIGLLLIFIVHPLLWTIELPAKRLKQRYIYRTKIIELFYEGNFATVVKESRAILQEYPESLYFINYLGQSLFYLGYVDEALVQFEQLKNLSISKKDNLNLAMAYHNLGKIENHRENIDLAISYYKKALNINKELKHKIGQALNHQHLSICYLNGKKINEALKHINQAIAIQDKMNDLHGFGNSYHILAQIRYHNEEPHQNVINAYLKSIHFLKKTEFTYSLYAIHSNLAYFQFHRKNYPEALKLFLSGLTYAKKMKNPLWIQTQHLNLAIVYIHLKQNKKARDHLNQVIKLKEEPNPLGDLAESQSQTKYKTEQTALSLIKKLNQTIAEHINKSD